MELPIEWNVLGRRGHFVPSLECEYDPIMNDFLKKNFALLLAFALPIVLIVVVAISSYLPSLLLSTDYNFIYSTCGVTREFYPYNCNSYLQKRYVIEGDDLVVKPVDLTQDSDKNGVPDFEQPYTDRIFLHDTQTNESREITLEEAQSLQLNALLTSPDGVTVSSHYSSGGRGFFLFDGGYSSYGYYLTKGKSKSKINLINTDDQYYYQDNFQFIGWVVPGRNQ